jgi:hypothetical protein
MTYLCGLDLGQAHDPTALCILAVSPATPARYDVVELWRFPLATPYPRIVGEVERLLNTEPLRGCSTVIVDQTGVGAPVVDLLREAKLPRLIAVSIHGGDLVTQSGLVFRVPKRDLVGVVQMLLQQRRLRIASALPEAATLQHELLNFRVTIDPRTAHDSYAAWREAAHDDLVLAVALAAWWGERRQRYRARAWGRD